MGRGAKPEIEKPTDILIQIKSVGVCGSDVHYFQNGRIGSQIVEFPYVVGHECSGEIAAVGPEVTHFKVGDRVVVDPAISCYQCSQCQVGRFHTCKNLKFLGTPASKTTLGLDGCLREFIVMPEKSVFHLPEKFDFEDGALLEPLTIGFYAVQKGETRAGQTAAILGSGPIGLSVLTAIRLKNPGAVYSTDLIPERVETAQKLGATRTFNSAKMDSVEKILELEPEGVDLVFECAGQQETIDAGIRLLKPGGTLVLIGIPQASRISGDIDWLRRKEIRVQNIRRQNDCTGATIQTIAAHDVDLAPFKTHRFPPEQSQQAFELVQAYRDGVIKAFINWE
jgi:L-iditol 2-dehydrogenase